MYPDDNCSDCPDCPEVITPLPLPDLSGLCGDTYDLSCVIYTGPAIPCMGITANMFITDILDLFVEASTKCDCCKEPPQDCVLGPWSDWGACLCVDVLGTVTCTQTRTRPVVTAPANGGVLCGPLSETRDCTPDDVCFTFGGYLCETYEAVQVTKSVSGIYNNKPYYSFTQCGVIFNIWWETSDNKWHCNTDMGGVKIPAITDQTLDNGNLYYPISNNTTQLWINQNTGLTLFLISTTLTTCPPVEICFSLTIEGSTHPFTLYFNTGPSATNTNSGNYPFYNFNVVVEANNYNINIAYDFDIPRWVATSVELGTIGYLNTNAFLPIGTWVPNPTNIGNYMVNSVLSDTCVVPEDVDCVVTWGPWEDCGPGGTQNSYGVITTPPSGNGAPCPSLIQTQDCAFPFCNPPSNVVITISGADLIISFTAASGASTYDVVYSTNGGISYTTINTPTSPVSFPYTCGLTYTGYVVTHCTNGVTSNQVPFNITVPDCPAGPLCADLLEPFVTGVQTGGGVYTFKINNDGFYNALFPNTVWSTNGLVWAEKLTSTGFFIGGRFTQLPTGVNRKGLAKLTCAGQTDPNFIVTSGFLEYTNSQTNRGTVFAIDVDTALGRVYVGGNFSSWNGVPCNNIVCLDLFGGVVSGFNIGTGCQNGGLSTPYPSAAVNTLKVQADGKVLIGGQFTTYNGTTVVGLARINTNGTLDTGLVQGTGLSFLPNAVTVRDIQVDSSNRIYVAGDFASYNGNISTCLVRLLANGNYDSSFSITNKFTFPASKIIERTLIIGTKVYVAGYFTGYNGTAVKYLVRLNIADATLDNTFLLNNSVAPGTAILDIKEAYNGNILIAGDLQGYRGATNKFYHVLNPVDGEVLAIPYPVFPAGVLQLNHIGIV